ARGSDRDDDPGPRIAFAARLAEQLLDRLGSGAGELTDQLAAAAERGMRFVAKRGRTWHTTSRMRLPRRRIRADMLAGGVGRFEAGSRNAHPLCWRADRMRVDPRPDRRCAIGR